MQRRKRGHTRRTEKEETRSAPARAAQPATSLSKAEEAAGDQERLLALQHSLGNRAVQSVLTQHSGQGTTGVQDRQPHSAPPHALATQIGQAYPNQHQQRAVVSLKQDELEISIFRAATDKRKIVYKIQPATEREAAAIIWRDEKGSIVAILEIDTNENLNRYLKGEVTADELVSARRAMWSSLSIGKENLPIPSPQVAKGPKEHSTGTTESSETKQKQEQSLPSQTWLEEAVEKLRTSLERGYVKKLLIEAERCVVAGEDYQWAMDEAAEAALEILRRKTAAFDPQSAKREMVKELLKAMEEAMLLGGGEEAVESAMKKTADWAKSQLATAVERLKATPTKEMWREVADKAATVMLFGGDATEALELLTAQLPPPESEAKSGESE